MASLPNEPDASRSRCAMLAAALAVASAALLATNGSDPGDDRLFFGRWHSRHFGGAVLLGGGALWAAAAAVSPRGAANGAFAVFLAASSWLLLEAAGAIGVVSYPDLFRGIPSKLGRTPMPSVDIRGETLQDTATKWGIATPPIPFRYTTNQAGFRNRPDRDDAAVVLLGDSILVAALVPFDETVTARLEAALGERVMNVALIGISPQAEHELLREAELPLAGRLVLQFVFEGNDLVDSWVYTREALGESARPRRTAFQGTLVYNASMALKRWSQPVLGIATRRIGEIDGQRYTFRWTRETFEGYEAEIERIEAALLDFADEVTAAGGRYAVVFVPSKLRVLGPLAQWPEGSDLRDYGAHVGPLRDRLMRFGAARDLAVLDLTAPLAAAAAAGDIPWFWGDTHWNSAGHRVAADAIASWDALRVWRGAEQGP